jgi:hypothetical protein
LTVPAANRLGIRRFLIALLAVYAIVVVALAVNYAALWRAGELRSIDDIIELQVRDGAIYNALSIGFADYKYAFYRHTAPQVVAIGTSRAMQIGQNFFLASFYNLGGLTQGPAQANVLADRLLLRGKPPAVVIFALDFWTFCRAPTESGRDRRPSEFAHDGMGQPPRHFLIYRLIAEGRFTIADFARLLVSRESADDVDRIGLGARLGSSGFAADGSIHAAAPADDALGPRWQGTFARIDAGTDQFVKDCAVSEPALDALAVFVNRMEAAGSHVVLMLAPLPGAVIERMAAVGRYGYVDALRGVLAARYPQRFEDFFDLRGQAPDSEFLDGMHGGEVVYMRAILAMARRPGTGLRDLVDESVLAKQIREWSGHAEIPADPINKRFFR